MSYVKTILFFFLIQIVASVSAQNKDNFIQVSKNTLDGEKVGAVSLRGDTLLPTVYDVISNYDGKYFCVCKNGRCGVVDSTNKVLIPLIYQYASLPVEERLFVFNNSKAALCEKSGKVLTPYNYDDVWNFSEGIAKVRIGKKYGFIDKQGTTVVPIRFKDAQDYCYKGLVHVIVESWKDIGDYKLTRYNGTAEVFNVGYTTAFSMVFNKAGKVIYKSDKQENIKFLENGNILTGEFMSECLVDEVNQVVSKTGTVLFSRDNCSKLELIADNLLRVSSSSKKYGIIDLNGNVILKTNFKNISTFDYKDESLAKVVFPNDDFFFINKKWKMRRI